MQKRSHPLFFCALLGAERQLTAQGRQRFLLTAPPLTAYYTRPAPPPEAKPTADRTSIALPAEHTPRRIPNIRTAVQQCQLACQQGKYSYRQRRRSSPAVHIPPAILVLTLQPPRSSLPYGGASTFPSSVTASRPQNPPCSVTDVGSWRPLSCGVDARLASSILPSASGFSQLSFSPFAHRRAKASSYWGWSWLPRLGGGMIVLYLLLCRGSFSHGSSNTIKFLPLQGYAV